MRQSVRLRHVLRTCLLGTLAAGVLLLAPSQAHADRRAERQRIRRVVWEQMFDVLAKNNMRVAVPLPRERKKFFEQYSRYRGFPRYSGVSAEYGTANKRHQIEAWRLDRQYKATRKAPRRWDGSANLVLGLTWTKQAPPPRAADILDEPRSVTYRIGYRPVAPGTKVGSLDKISRKVEGRVIQKARAEQRSYAGLKGNVWIVEDRGLLPGRPVVWFSVLLGGAFIRDGARDGTLLRNVHLRAVHPAGDMGFAVLDLYMTVGRDPAPDLVSTEAKLHELMETFARLYLAATTQQASVSVGRVRLLDANPIYTRGMPVEDMASPEDLRKYVTTERKAAAADGVTKVVLEVEMSEAGVLKLAMPDANATPFEEGKVEMLFGGRAVPIGKGDEERQVAYALYTSPPSFAEPTRRVEGATHPSERFRDIVATRSVPLVASAGASVKKLKTLSKPIEVPLVRPPVLLVHGTFDKPLDCWESDASKDEPTLGTISMAGALREVGYAVFKVDFSKTNGGVGGDPAHSSFRHNARVLWENPQGIYDALGTYRDNWEVAVTQTDVVGHSLGGLIARLWVSEEYNPQKGADALPFDREGTVGYRRPGNFGQGDIHRLITIGTPHMGSDLGHLAIALESVPIARRKQLLASPISSVVSNDLKILEQGAFWAVGLFKGYGITPVVRNQRPFLEALRNPALQLIGATRVPSHAVVCRAAIPDVATFGRLYQHVLKMAAWWMLNARPGVVREFFTQRGQAADLDRLFGEVLDMDRREREEGAPPGAWLIDATHPIRPNDNFTLYALGRAILFGNTQNDMVVRVESQAGGLPLQYTTGVPGVLHSFAPRYERVQHAVIEALTGPGWRFADDGFPTPKPMRNIQPLEVEQDPASRNEAIDESNIVASHAQSLSYVARQENIIIMMRPVNEHATALIARNMATKDMHVKGKSANWGPQRGFIAVEQRFSKIYLSDPANRAEKIEKFDGKVQECLADNRARETPLTITANGKSHDVLVVEGDDLEPPQAIVLRLAEGGDVKGWESGGEMTFDPTAALPAPRLSAEEIADRGTRPFMVLSDRHTRIPLTADYDILAFGPTFAPGETSSDPEMGFVIEWQKALITQMNNEIRLRANFAGGNVSHHGPETQFTFSEGADYPISTFEPDGDIWIIEQGPQGKQDLYLKRYFHVMRAQGWHLDPNPHTWNWGDYDPEKWPSTGWRPDDQLQVTDKVLQEDNPYDSDEGDEALALPAKAGGR